MPPYLYQLLTGCQDPRVCLRLVQLPQDEVGASLPHQLPPRLCGCELSIRKEDSGWGGGSQVPTQEHKFKTKRPKRGTEQLGTCSSFLVAKPGLAPS